MMPYHSSPQVVVFGEKQLTELLSVDATGRIIWPIEAFRKETLTIQSKVALKQSRNMVGFLSLFPSHGEIYERQATASKCLTVYQEGAAFISKKLKERFLPNDWRKLEDCVDHITEGVRENITRALSVLRHNNMITIEQGVRHAEFSALQTLLDRKMEFGIIEVMKDGEFYFSAQTIGKEHVGREEQDWRLTIKRFLEKQYLMGQAAHPAPALVEHMKNVSELSHGALYAYTAVLAIAYPLPSPQVKPPALPEPDRYAPNPVEWVYQWRREFARIDKKKKRIEK